MRYVFNLNDISGGANRAFTVPADGSVYVVKDSQDTLVNQSKSPDAVAIGDTICTHGTGCPDGVVQDPIETV